MAERLSAMDANFLFIEKANVHMHVAGVAVLDPSTRPDGTLPFEDVVDLVERRIHLVPRFRQRVLFPPLNAGLPVWADDPSFDLGFHIRRAALPAPGGRRELADQIQRVHSRPLDRSKPLWEMYFIEGLENGHVAVLWKSHHAMIDGMSGMDIATVLFDLTPEPRAVEPEAWTPAPAPSPVDLLRDALVEQVAHPLRSAIQGAQLAVRAPQEVVDRVRQTVGGLASFVAGGPTAPQHLFNEPVGPNRRFSMCDVPVEDAKAIKNALGGKVNDVVLTAVAGALNRVLRARGTATDGMTLRAMIPVSTRDESHSMALGNKVSSFFVDLPIGAADPAERYRRVVEATKNLKDSHQAVGASMIMNAGSWAPPTLHALAARVAGRSRVANLVISNVPGPQIPIYLCGARQVVTYPAMPLGETIALGIAVTSLDGTMGFGFTSDWDALPDIDELAAALLASFDDLKKAASV